MLWPALDRGARRTGAVHLSGGEMVSAAGLGERAAHYRPAAKAARRRRVVARYLWLSCMGHMADTCPWTHGRLVSIMSKKPQNVDDWLTKQQAAQVLGLAEKSLDRMATRGEIQKAMRKRPGLPPQAVFHPGDVDRAKAEREKPFVMPSGTTSTSVPVLSNSAAMPAVIQAISGIKQRSDGVRLPERLYLTIEEAAEFTGLGVGYIRKQIREGKITPRRGAGPRGADVLRRADLEGL